MNRDALSIHALIYDAARQQVIVFGGGVDSSPGADTWAWSGEDWTQLSDGGPSARVRHGAAYDSTRQRVVLFGGVGAGATLLRDTWEWDGGVWTQVAETGPSPRQLFVMAFDSTRNRTVLFGGCDAAGASMGDTWEWDGKTWTRASDFGASKGCGGSMAFDGNECVMFGGADASIAGAHLFPTTWAWGGKHWALRQDMGPGPRWRQAMAFDNQRGALVLFGGLNIFEQKPQSGDGGILGDTWEHFTQADATGPLTITDLQISPTAFKAGQTGQLTISLSGPAQPTTPAVVIFTDPSNSIEAVVNMQQVPVPVQVTVPPGSTRLVVQVVASRPAPQVTVVAQLGGRGKSVPISITA
jgi:hypothetical protein